MINTNSYKIEEKSFGDNQKDKVSVGEVEVDKVIELNDLEA